jgi:hypothetical protein
MIVHAMSSYDLCSLDMMFYGYESMFMIYIYIYIYVTHIILFLLGDPYRKRERGPFSCLLFLFLSLAYLFLFYSFLSFLFLIFCFVPTAHKRTERESREAYFFLLLYKWIKPTVRLRQRQRKRGELLVETETKNREISTASLKGKSCWFLLLLWVAELTKKEGEDLLLCLHKIGRESSLRAAGS